MGLPIPLRTGAKFRAKPPAVLVKVAAGSSYADTVRAVRNNSEVNLVELGAQVTGMRKTRDGHLLVELAKGAGSVVAAQKLSSAIATRLGDAVGGVSQLSQFTVVEFVDLDAAAQITGLWSTRSGQQIATARMTRASAAIVTRVPIGWTMCRVRPRRPEPEKCFRCHGFGHRSDNCSGPDLSLNCRRCGEPGHELKVCLADKDRWVCVQEGGAQDTCWAQFASAVLAGSQRRWNTLEAMIHCLQINLHTDWAAQQLLSRTVLNMDIGLLILSEHNRSPCNYSSWASSSNGRCSIALTTIAGIGAEESGSGPGFAWLRLGNVRAFSCYWTPNGDSAADRLEAFKGFLDGLDQAIRQGERENETLLVAGDFNAKSAYWGSSVDDSKGETLEFFAASLGLWTNNVGSHPTLQRGASSSVIDVTFSGPGPYEVVDWEVLDDYSGSDHNYITFNLIP
ncbi:hypothetical protein QTP88_014401 [Uroleucon formosanum]